MKIRNLLFGFVLSMMVLCAGSFTVTSRAASNCGSSCVQNYSFCKSTCGGDPMCLAQCKDEYDCCQIICHGGTCLTK